LIYSPAFIFSRCSWDRCA